MKIGDKTTQLVCTKYWPRYMFEFEMILAARVVIDKVVVIACIIVAMLKVEMV